MAQKDLNRPRHYSVYNGDYYEKRERTQRDC